MIPQGFPLMIKTKKSDDKGNDISIHWLVVGWEYPADMGGWRPVVVRTNTPSARAVVLPTDQPFTIE